MKKKLIVLVAAASLIMSMLTFSGCGSQSASVGVKTVKMASLVTLTGPAAGWGLPLEEGCKWAVTEVNEQGGLLIGKDKYKIDYQKFDDQYSGSAAATEAQKIVDSDIHYVYGPLGNDGERAAAPIFEAGKVFNAGMSAAEYLKEAVKLGYKYYWNASYPNVSWLRNVMDGGTKVDPNAKTVITLNPDDDFGHSAADVITVVAKEKGLQLESYFYKPGTTDFYPVLTPIVKKNPDVFYTGHSQGGDMALQIKQIRELGYKGKIWGDSCDWKQLTDIAGLPALEGLRYVYTDYSADTWPAAVKDANKRYLTRYTDKKEMQFTTYIAYEAMQVYFQAMQKAGSVEPEAVLKVFDDPNFKYTLMGKSDQSLGGMQTYGARRQLQLTQGFATITNGKPQQAAIATSLTP